MILIICQMFLDLFKFLISDDFRFDFSQQCNYLFLIICHMFLILLFLIICQMFRGLFKFIDSVDIWSIPHNSVITYSISVYMPDISHFV